jgi:hypothetical protein
MELDRDTAPKPLPIFKPGTQGTAGGLNREPEQVQRVTQSIWNAEFENDLRFMQRYFKAADCKPGGSAISELTRLRGVYVDPFGIPFNPSRKQANTPPVYFPPKGPKSPPLTPSPGEKIPDLPLPPGFPF